MVSADDRRDVTHAAIADLHILCVEDGAEAMVGVKMKNSHKEL